MKELGLVAVGAWLTGCQGKILEETVIESHKGSPVQTFSHLRMRCLLSQRASEKMEDLKTTTSNSLPITRSFSSTFY